MGIRESEAVLEKMRQVLMDFSPTLGSWIVGSEKRLNDPFETEYSENYAPATAAVIFSSLYNITENPGILSRAHDMLKRSAKLLQDKKGISPFCRVFLLHYSLMALLVLPAGKKSVLTGELGHFYTQYVDDCKQINTNCAALQWGAELFCDALGYRDPDVNYLNYLLTFIEESQNEYGFINDEVSHDGGKHDGMPIAYHLFTLFVLTSVIVVIEKWNPHLLPQRHRAESIIANGFQWLKHAISLDGTFGMIERSSYQMFTWGAFVALCSYAGLTMEVLRKTLEHWLDFQHNDGSYSCTPNHLPHGLRTGFETYTRVNMYNNLGMTGIAIAERILARGLALPNQDLSSVPHVNQFVDAQSGYAFVRNGSHFFGCTLRMHNRRYAPAMQGFHYRLASCKLPIAEAKLIGYERTSQEFLLNGVWEGYLLKDAEGRMYYPDVIENVKTKMIVRGVEMELENEVLHCLKSIKLLQTGIRWNYKITPKQDFVSCDHVLPMLVFDGKQGTRFLKKSGKLIKIDYAGRHYQLTCDASSEMNNSLTRSLVSVSGVSTNTYIKIDRLLHAGETIEWCTELHAL